MGNATCSEFLRRHSWPVTVGHVTIGGDNPVVVQSMTTTSTLDTAGSAAQAARIAAAGGRIVRLTTQGVPEAANLTHIREALTEMGVDVPLVADVHFNPRAAFEAARRVEKVRINPGNFVDPGRTFKKIDYTDEEYLSELERIRQALVPLLDLCREHGTALRIGVNHGSLSDRIMSRYGDTPAGMVESAMEFLRVCVAHDFREVVISIKASNVLVMTETMRRLVEAMKAEDMYFPLHLGVTEAGDAEDGRVKSAVGIGSLLLDGIGDTIRVSLSEEPEYEIPVACSIIAHVDAVASAPKDYQLAPPVSPAPGRRKSAWTGRTTRIEGLDSDFADAVDIVLSQGCDNESLFKLIPSDHARPVRLSASGVDWALRVRSFVESMTACGYDNPVILAHRYSDEMPESVMIKAAVDYGYLLLAGLTDAISIEADGVDRLWLNSLALNILQATRLRFSKTEFISCPGCGRTLYDLQSTLHTIKKATSHLKGLKIGVMGCIVNGPGEMADADYGYVGAAPGKVSLYKGKECMKKNVPASEALDSLIELIKANGDWRDTE